MCGGCCGYISPVGIILMIPSEVYRSGKNFAEEFFTKRTLDKAVSSAWLLAHQPATDKKLIEINIKLKLNRTDSSLYCQRALVYLLQKKFREADQDLQSAILNSPKYFLARYYRSMLYMMTGHKDTINAHTEAINLYTNESKEITLFDSLTDVGEKMENTLHEWKQSLPDPFGLKKLRQGRHEEATVVSKALKQSVNLADLYNNRGLAKFKVEQYYESIEDFEKAISLSQANSENLALYYFNLGQVYYYIHNVEQAIQYFTMSAKTKSVYQSKAYAMRSYAYMRLGNTDQGEKDKATALKIDPLAPVDQFQYRLLPRDQFQEILSFLSPKDLVHVALTNHHLKEIAYAPFLWPLRSSMYLGHNIYYNYHDPRLQFRNARIAHIYGDDIHHECNCEFGPFEEFAPHLEYLTLQFSYSFDEPKTQEFLNKCVKLKSLKLDVPVLKDLDLSGLKQLRELDLMDSHGLESPEFVKTILSKVGHQLHKLCISNGYSDSELDEIAKTYCKNLKKLTTARVYNNY
jgi:tetratricopeptide (TPR) repeat protein